MLNRSQFYALVAQLNSYRKLLAQSVNSYVIPKEQTIQAPELNQSNDYYFLFEQQQRNSEDAVVYGITCFDSDGVIIFNRRGVFPVSLWRYRRQGAARTATMFQGLVRNIFRTEHIPLEIEVPFSKVDDNIWQCHILWNKYNLYNS